MCKSKYNTHEKTPVWSLLDQNCFLNWHHAFGSVSQSCASQRLFQKLFPAGQNFSAIQKAIGNQPSVPQRTRSDRTSVKKLMETILKLAKIIISISRFLQDSTDAF